MSRRQWAIVRERGEGLTVSESPIKTRITSRSYANANRLKIATVKGRMICRALHSISDRPSKRQRYDAPKAAYFSAR